MKNFLKKLDHLICQYLGLHTSMFTPCKVKMNNNEIIIYNTESFKRHLYKENWNKVNLSEIKKSDKEKLGIAIGKAIAKNLVISFEEIKIKHDFQNA